MAALALIAFGSPDPFNFKDAFMTIKTRSSKASTVTEDQAEQPKRKTITRTNKSSKSNTASSEVVSEPTAIIEESSVANAAATPTIAANPGVVLEGLDQPVTGRSVFAVRTLGTAVSVESVFIKEDGDALRLPAVFPDRQYALSQIDELRQIVSQHFDELEKQLSNPN